MNTDFRLLDLRSQAAAVRQHLYGKAPQEVIDWLRAKDAVSRNRSPTYTFLSSTGLRSVFYFRDNQLIVLWEDSASSA